MKSKVSVASKCLSRLDNIKQWQELDTINKESVSQHSFKVACYASILLEEVFNENYGQGVKDLIYLVINHALFHDFDEAFVKRDLSHEVKYNNYNGEEIRDVINDFARNSFIDAFQISSFKEGKELCFNNDAEIMLYRSVFPEKVIVKKFVKFCDWLAMCNYVMRELRMGNMNFSEKLQTCKDGISNSGEDLISELKILGEGSFNEKPIREIMESVLSYKN